MDQLAGFMFASFALIASPGPNTLSLAATAAAFGFRRSLRFLTGLLLGMIVVMTVTATGVAAMIIALPGMKPMVTVAATAYFVYLAYRIATAPPIGDTDENREAPSALAGLAICLANPKAYAAMAAVFSGFVLIAERPAMDAAAKIALLAVMILLVNLCWLTAGAALTRFFRDPKSNRAINIAFAASLLIAVGLTLA